VCIVGVLLSIFAALIPTAIYGWFVNWLDRHEKEPWWLQALVFLWGAVPAFFLALIAQLLLDIPTTWVLAEEELTSELVGGSLWAPVTEEIAKGLGVVLVLVLARREMDSILDGIVYGAMAGLGFAFTENILYFGGALVEEGWGGWAFTVLLRTIPFGLNHAFFSGLTGAGLGAAYLSFRRQVKWGAPVGGLAAGMLFHGVHNLGASLAAANCLSICLSFVVDWGGILMLGVLIALVWRQEKSWIVEHLAGEVTDEVLQLIITWKLWRRARWKALVQLDRAAWREQSQLRQDATELAFKKHQMTRRGQDPKTQREIEGYRQRLAELGATHPDQLTNCPANKPTEPGNI
jgi:RsiW-degrading membrane proteinase PrsW (M82 family)